MSVNTTRLMQEQQRLIGELVVARDNHDVETIEELEAELADVEDELEDLDRFHAEEHRFARMAR